MHLRRRQVSQFPPVPWFARLLAHPVSGTWWPNCLPAYRVVKTRERGQVHSPEPHGPTVIDAETPFLLGHWVLTKLFHIDWYGLKINAGLDLLPRVFHSASSVMEKGTTTTPRAVCYVLSFCKPISNHSHESLSESRASSLCGHSWLPFPNMI